ncbi:MAG: phosphodiester glycosidase family protein [bacterium]|nr:phosphodiester glycosidase family protein [bacterium]
MDTLILTRVNVEKVATSATSIALAIFMLVSQSFIFASGIGLTNHKKEDISVLTEMLSNQLESEEEFNNELSSKYSKGVITDIDRGIKHIKLLRYYNGRPVRINVVEISREVNPNLTVEPAIASSTLAGRTKISAIAQRENAIVAINGGYFKPQTGVPLGTLMINGKIYTGPIYDRVAIGFFDNNYEIARVKLKAILKTNIGELKIDNINQPRMLSTNVLVYTPDWGVSSPPSPKYGKQIVIENGKLVNYTSSSNVIPQNGYVIVGPEKELNKVVEAKKFNLDISINPEWKGVNHIISGGPYLVKNNEVYVDMTDQKLASIGGRNPRTAIGYTENNHLIMITVDGRENASIGLTLFELANLMKELGCVNAINLDGGGSTVMYINGKIVNQPAMKGGIPLSHTLTISNKKLS